MFVKKLLLLAVCSGVAICLNGCMSRGEHLTYTLKSDQEQSDEIMENIVNALEEKDSAALLNQFSEQARTQQEDLQQQIETLIEWYQGKVKEFNGNAATREHNNRGKLIEKTFWGTYTLITDKMTYHVAYNYQQASENEDEIGLSALEFVTEDVYEKAKEEGGHYKWYLSEDVTGVYWTD